MRKIIAVDFDGTLTIGDCWPEIGEPNWPVINYILEQQKHGAYLILWTCRQEQPLEYAIEWCKDRGVIFDAVNENIKERLEEWGGLESRKIYADEYIDDKTKNPDYCDVLYYNNAPRMLAESSGGREMFKTRICGILHNYFSVSYWEMKQIAERMIRELWEI